MRRFLTMVALAICMPSLTFAQTDVQSSPPDILDRIKEATWGELKVELEKFDVVRPEIAAVIEVTDLITAKKPKSVSEEQARRFLDVVKRYKLEVPDATKDLLMKKVRSKAELNQLFDLCAKAFSHQKRVVGRHLYIRQWMEMKLEDHPFAKVEPLASWFPENAEGMRAYGELIDGLSTYEQNLRNKLRSK